MNACADGLLASSFFRISHCITSFSLHLPLSKVVPILHHSRVSHTPSHYQDVNHSASQGSRVSSKEAMSTLSTVQTFNLSQVPSCQLSNPSVKHIIVALLYQLYQHQSVDKPSVTFLDSNSVDTASPHQNYSIQLCTCETRRVSLPSLSSLRQLSVYQQLSDSATVSFHFLGSQVCQYRKSQLARSSRGVCE